ncbi:Hypothetical protein CINCED_3A025926 [Cinara cedri]|uniref:Uncharacterized protein n=1 Tax=Cinara cedri TaxID=506608 RepID=A0A5E4MTI9_9HEMI|nr:Hypothetical protein CINCED_3A025926 [Cinara cedri]
MFVLNALKKVGSLASSRIWTNQNDENEEKNENDDQQETNYSMFDDEVEDEHVDEQENRQLVLDEVVKYEKLERQIHYADKFVEDMMEDSKWLIYKFDEIFNKLGDKCIGLSTEINSINKYVECLNTETDNLNTNYKYSQEVLKDLEEENLYLEENINQLEECLFKEQKNKTCLEYQNDNQKMCLEYKYQQIAQEKKKLVEKTDELKREKEETSCVLKLKLNDCESEKKELNKEKSLQIIMVDKLKKELELEKNYGQKLNETICRQNNKKQELDKELQKCKEQYELLKQISETESTRADTVISTLRTEKTFLDLERRKAETEFNQNKKELEKFGYETEQLNMDIMKIQSKLDSVIKNSDENDKLSMERVGQRLQDNEQLTIDLHEKERCIVELRTTLSEMKMVQRKESDEVRSLRTQVNDLKVKQNNMEIEFGEYPGNGDHNSIINYNPQTSSENITGVDSFLSAGENNIQSAPSVLKRTKSVDEFEEKNTNFENLIKKCNSLLNYYS